MKRDPNKVKWKERKSLLEQSLLYSTWDDVERAARSAVKEHNNHKFKHKFKESPTSFMSLNKVVNVQEWKKDDGVLFHITLETNDAQRNHIRKIWPVRDPKPDKYNTLYYWAQVWVKPPSTEVIEATFIGYTYRYKS